jgi:hypothetical protein
VNEIIVQVPGVESKEKNERGLEMSGARQSQSPPRRAPSKVSVNYWFPRGVLLTSTLT